MVHAMLPSSTEISNVHHIPISRPFSANDYPYGPAIFQCKSTTASANNVAIPSIPGLSTTSRHSPH